MKSYAEWRWLFRNENGCSQFNRMPILDHLQYLLVVDVLFGGNFTLNWAFRYFLSFVLFFRWAHRYAHWPGITEGRSGDPPPASALRPCPLQGEQTAGRWERWGAAGRPAPTGDAQFTLCAAFNAPSASKCEQRVLDAEDPESLICYQMRKTWKKTMFLKNVIFPLPNTQGSYER